MYVCGGGGMGGGGANDVGPIAEHQLHQLTKTCSCILFASHGMAFIFGPLGLAMDEALSSCPHTCC